MPLLVSMPHIGIDIPQNLRPPFVARALEIEDTDWHLKTLYDFLPAMGASVLTPTVSRYVIDLNRPPDDMPMYPGASNTELCPTKFFTGDPLYKSGWIPNEEERAWRRKAYWEPYHRAMKEELARIKAIHGYVLLWDAHSIRTEIPWLFEGTLPDLNIGTAGGSSTHIAITNAVTGACRNFPHFSTAVNGRFKGGYITRHYGKPSESVHAIQLEMCQRLYMEEQHPFAYDEGVASKVKPLLIAMLSAALTTCTGLYEKK
jgi:N-formylglutamate deformylase